MRTRVSESWEKRLEDAISPWALEIGDVMEAITPIVNEIAEENHRWGYAEGKHAAKPEPPGVTLRRVVICERFLKERGPLTADEVAVLAGWGDRVASRPMSELFATGVVRKTGERRLTRRGHTAAVFELI